MLLKYAALNIRIKVFDPLILPERILDVSRGEDQLRLDVFFAAFLIAALKPQTTEITCTKKHVMALP